MKHTSSEAVPADSPIHPTKLITDLNLPTNSIPKSIFNSLQSKDKSNTYEELNSGDYDQSEYDGDDDENDDDDEDEGTIHPFGPDINPNTLLHTLTQKEHEQNIHKIHPSQTSEKTDHFLNISMKHSEGDTNMKALIPGPPRDLVAQLVNQYVTLSWLEPSKNPDEVISYTVFYKMTSSERYEKHSLFGNKFHFHEMQ